LQVQSQPELCSKTLSQNKKKQRLGMWLNGRALAYHVQGPGFDGVIESKQERIKTKFIIRSFQTTGLFVNEGHIVYMFRRQMKREVFHI
jgi:hypothetical protein